MPESSLAERLTFPHGVSAIILREGEVLSCRRRTSELWGYPGGKIDAGESPLAAVLRETQEETGILLDPGQLVLIHEGPCHNRDPRDRPYWVYAFLAVVGADCQPRAMPGEPPSAWMPHAEFLRLSAFPDFNQLTLGLALTRASHGR